MEEPFDFLQNHIELSKYGGFWSDEPKDLVIKATLRVYRREILREWDISDITFNEGRALIKWEKRRLPLTDSEMEQKFGIETNHPTL